MIVVCRDALLLFFMMHDVRIVDLVAVRSILESLLTMVILALFGVVGAAVDIDLDGLFFRWRW